MKTLVATYKRFIPVVRLDFIVVVLERLKGGYKVKYRVDTSHRLATPVRLKRSSVLSSRLEDRILAPANHTQRHAHTHTSETNAFTAIIYAIRTATKTIARDQPDV